MVLSYIISHYIHRKLKGLQFFSSQFFLTTFRLESRAEQQKYGDIVLDFAYFKAADGFNKKIENSSVSIHASAHPIKQIFFYS